MVTVIGLGEVGFATFSELNKKIKCYGVDINQELLAKLSQQGYSVGAEIKSDDVFIIAVYTTEQVLSVIDKIDTSHHPLIIVESTIEPKFAKKLEQLAKKKKVDLVLFPHRFNPNDPEHYVFNLDRVIGGVNETSLNKALEFYSQFMDKKLIHVVPFRIAALSKVVENAYRFLEISLAQSLKIDCDKLRINFDELRNSVNTKWNINLKEARDGIGGKCLPKDAKLLSDFFKKDKFLKLAVKLNEEYKEYAKKPN